MMADLPRRKPIPMPLGYQASPLQHPNMYGHSRTRTTSSSVFPQIPHPQHPQHQQLYPNHMQVHASYHSRRTPSTNTFSTTASSGNGPVPNRQASQDLQRSGSSRSGSSPQTSSYVALMRKQKATVWCDRAQQENPQVLAAQRHAKMKASKEVSGGAQPQRISSASGSGSLAGSNRVTAKIRHHGKAGLVGYSPGDLVGGVGGVPMRLSASEVEGGDSDDDGDSTNLGGKYHQRSGSGRSSVGSGRSGRRGLTYRQSGASSTGKWSQGNTPPSERERQGSNGTLTDVTETPMPGPHQQRGHDYFGSNGGDGTRSVGSGSSGERNDSVAELSGPDAARLASNSLLKSTVTREKSVRNPEELRRRGSVDERTMTLSAGRLYIANPDADSD
ncbi:hypothetical protein HYFRA_00012790 [Hymenoscyphus fraxineus]|uniref:Uncharacterized protein n=1 Tax=Hymenoscyphus fraxineus TaxID=746836 RepID=A0A9N9L9Q7_9HELO|nr:hypothetical protein HYFRA_00012790 [Hymenoscyphus fraxineus]